MTSSTAAAPFPAWRRAGGLVFTSGQLALDPASALTPQGLRPLGADCETQAHACLDRLAAVLLDAGTSLERVLRIECFLASATDLPAWHAAFLARFAAERPTRTTVIASPPAPGFLIELQAVAALD